jgi:phage shock protein C
MTTMNAQSDRHFYRDADRAILGGVCAGLAGYLGFNLKMTRFLAFIAFLMAMPIAVIAYLAAVFLIPSASSGKIDSIAESHYEKYCSRRDKRQSSKAQEAYEEPGSLLAEELSRRCKSMDERLARLEKHVTSKRFQIDQELSRL